MDKKEMIIALEEHFQSKAKYLGPPKFAYALETEIGTLHIERYGTIRSDSGEEMHFEDLMVTSVNESTRSSGSVGTGVVMKPSAEILSVTIPLGLHTGKSLINLINMVSSKQDLIFRAFGLEVMGMVDEVAKDMADKKPQTISEFESALKEIGPEKCQLLTFDFDKQQLAFNIDGSELSEAEINAFMDLTALMNEAAISASHISRKPVSTDNPKYTFRVWLLRLGMLGERYKYSRAALLSRLPGNSAFRSPKKAVTIE